MSVGVVDSWDSDDFIHIESTLLSASGQYFASTMVIVGMSVVATVIVLQFHHHSPDSGPMPRWVSWIPPAYLYLKMCLCAPFLISVCLTGALGSAAVGPLVPADEASR